MTPGELTRDLEEGTADASERANVEPLAGEELRYLEDIFSSPSRFVAVDEGREVVLTYDGAPLKMIRTGVSVNRIQSMQIYEKLFGADTLEMAHVDYSYKPVKHIISWEQSAVEQALLITVPPMFYGAMPNLGLYSQPDGPFSNPAELIPAGKLREAMASYEAAVDAAVRDIVFIGSAMVESGVDGINLDTVGAAGDADALAGLLAAEKLTAKYPGICIELGKAGEFILGLHGSLCFHGQRLAGLYPHQQVKVAEQAGVTIFGPAINTNTSKSIPWNLARAITFVKACCEASTIPVHANMGMGVGAVTVNDNPPVDVLSRASKAMVEICRLDGL